MQLPHQVPAQPGQLAAMAIELTGVVVLEVAMGPLPTEQLPVQPAQAALTPLAAWQAALQSGSCRLLPVRFLRAFQTCVAYSIRDGSSDRFKILLF